jgi:AcrR family transcriptional regulator
MKEKQEQILNAALKLFVEFGFHATPTSKIAKEAGVATGTLFHYFKTKDELIVALYVILSSKLNDYACHNITEDDHLEQSLRKSFLNNIEWSQQYRAEFNFIQQFKMSRFLLRVSKDQLGNYDEFLFQKIQEGIATNILKSLPVEFLLSLFTNQVIGINQYLLTSELSAQAQHHLISDAFDMLWEMIS